jgi:hypothetical protein
MSLQRPLTARTIRFGALFAVFSLCLLLLSGLSQAGDKRPFKATVHGFADPWPTDNDPVVVEVQGNGTHLGNFDEVLYHHLEGGDFWGNAVFTAANGDQLYTEFSGFFTSLPDGEGWITFEVTHEVVGGTGRFRGATGSFDGVNGRFNFNTGEDEAGYK